MDNPEIDQYGNKFWRKDNKTHREDGPAIEWENGVRSWLINGNYHREDGPARTWFDRAEEEEWWLNGYHYGNFNMWLEDLKAPIGQKVLLKLRYG